MQPIISNGYHGGDIGPASQQLFADALEGKFHVSLSGEFCFA
jgi:hypothetical protein